MCWVEDSLEAAWRHCTASCVDGIADADVEVLIVVVAVGKEANMMSERM